MSPKTTRFLAAVLLSSTLASPVLAEQVRLKSADGNIDMMVELLSYDDANYEIRLGGATASSLVPRSALACEGAACPPGVAATAEAPAAEEEKEAEPVYAERRPDPDLVIIGSDSVGEDLLPLMLSPYAEMLGGAASEPEQVSKSLAQFSFRGNGGQGEEILLMEVDSTSSGPGIDALIAGEADIAMSSRGAKPDEVRALLAQGRGNLLDVSQEYIVAVDSVLMIVHESIPINELSRNQLRDIYAGRISNWSDVGGPNLPIVLIGRDGGSARENFEAWTFDGPATLSPNFIEVDGGKDMTRRVMAEPGGIGYTINDNVLEAKPIDLILDCGLRMEATNFKTKAEEYMLGRRIRLYVDKGPHAPEVQKLLDLMISPSVDGLTADSGYTDLGIDRDEKGLERLVQAALVGQPDRTILNAVDRMQVDLRGAVRLSMTFRFETASWDLDRKALRDMDRLAKTLANPEYEGKEIIFVGFADARGEFDYNVWLSKGRSQSVLDEIRSRADAGALRGRDLVAKGFGEMAPMGCNDTVEGLSRNRRVEVWVR